MAYVHKIKSVASILKVGSLKEEARRFYFITFTKELRKVKEYFGGLLTAGTVINFINRDFYVNI